MSLKAACVSLILYKNFHKIPCLQRTGPGPLPMSNMKLLRAILKLKTFSSKILLQIASSMLLLEVLDQLLEKYDFLNILGHCLSRMKNYLLCKIIAQMCSGCVN